MLNMPFWAYLVQISTTFLESSTEAFSSVSSLMFFLMNSTARYAPVVTAWARVAVRGQVPVGTTARLVGPGRRNRLARRLKRKSGDVMMAGAPAGAVRLPRTYRMLVGSAMAMRSQWALKLPAPQPESMLSEAP